MKSLQLLLILSIIGYCFSQTEVFDCEGQFENQIKEKCEAIGSCSYNNIYQTCIETHVCSFGNDKSSSDCSAITPKNFNLEKCILDTDGKTCKETPKECSDYDSALGDDCSKLKAPTDKRCVLDNKDPAHPCAAHFDECSKITAITTADVNNNECTNNIPKETSEKCKWNTEGTTSFCENVERYCNEALIKDIDNCHKLPLKTDEPDKDKKQCIYKGSNCIAEYIKCEERTIISPGTGADCENYSPLNDDKDDYNYAMKCTHNTAITDSIKCKPVNRKCNNYNSPIPIPTELLSEELCNQLEVTETYQKCVYDVENGVCKEEYKTCEDYITNKVETDRTNCESIVLSDKTKHCVYIPKEDKCVTRNIYSECKDYEGKDKKICESIILSPYNRPYCILDKDSECIEKPLNCTEATSEDECLKLAKASESNKKCAYDGSKCYEEYIRCEDILENVVSDCSSSRKMYDGKKCKYDSSSTSSPSSYRCRSIFKTCSDTNQKEECKLIAKTGVTNPDRRVCDWIETTGGTSGSCVDNYKYCSDYRGTDPDICKRIKPYDETGDNIDVGFKCSLDERDVGCQKVPVECSDAGTNPILCESYSQYIKDKEKKYCFFDGTNCKAHFKKCEYFESNRDGITCTNNIIEGLITPVCEIVDSKCVAKGTCTKFITATSSSTYKGLLCKSLNPNCTYITDSDTGLSKCEYNENSCNQIKFYSDSESNKEICENMQVTNPHKKCALKEDKTGCEEIYRELEYSTNYISYTPQETSSEGNSSGFIEKGIHLIMALLCLLI